MARTSVNSHPRTKSLGVIHFPGASLLLTARRQRLNNAGTVAVAAPNLRASSHGKASLTWPTRLVLNTLRIALTLGALLATAGAAHAETTVPLELQVDLMRRVVRFERGFVGRL